MESITEYTEVSQALSLQPEWVKVLPMDPREMLLQSEEPFTVYRTLKELLGFPKNHPVARKIREFVLDDKRVQTLVKTLPDDWKSYLVKGHQKADYPPSLLLFLFDLGVEPKDFIEIQNVLQQMLELQDDEGRFMSLAQFPRSKPVIGSSPCDTHIITEVLLLGGFGESAQVRKAVDFIASNLTDTSQGIGWKCEPNSASNARGPGRKDDICPQVTLEALRLFSHMPKKTHPKTLIDAGRTLLQCYEQSDHRPYMFGHGSRFKKLRPPFFWYGIDSMLDTFSRFDELSKESAFTEMLSIVLAKANEDGTFTPESIYRDFKLWSFGQKKEWSPWLTFYICRILERVYG